MKKSMLLIFGILIGLLSLGAYADPFNTVENMSQYEVLKGRLSDIIFTESGAERIYSDIEIYSKLPGDELLRSEKRSIRLLDFNQLNQYFIDGEKLDQVFGTNGSQIDDYYIFANFKNGFNNVEELEDYTYREAQYWIAVIPRFATIEHMVLQEEQFHMGVGSHFQLRFVLDTPILLIPQDHDPDAYWNKKIKDFSDLDYNDSRIFHMRGPMLIPGDFVYTLNAVRTVNGPKNWGVVDGGLGSFANALGFVSTYHIAIDQTEDNYVKQFHLAIDSDAANNILEYAVAASSTFKEAGIYHSVHNACHTAALEALSAGIELYPYEEFNPYRIIEVFYDSGLIVSELSSLNEVFDSEVTLERFSQNRNYRLAHNNMSILTSNVFDKALVDIANMIVEENIEKEELLVLKVLLTKNGQPETEEEIYVFQTVKQERILYLANLLEMKKEEYLVLLENYLGIPQEDLEYTWKILSKLIGKYN